MHVADLVVTAQVQVTRCGWRREVLVPVEVGSVPVVGVTVGWRGVDHLVVAGPAVLEGFGLLPFGVVATPAG